MAVSLIDCQNAFAAPDRFQSSGRWWYNAENHQGGNNKWVYDALCFGRSLDPSKTWSTHRHAKRTYQGPMHVLRILP